MDDPVWDHSTFSFNRERLFDAEIAQRFFEHTVLLARLQDLISDEHFSVDSTLLEAWRRTRASGRRTVMTAPTAVTSAARSAATTRMPRRPHPDARLIHKGKEAKLSYLANALIENRYGLLVGIDVRHATGTGERDGALASAEAHLRSGATLRSCAQAPRHPPHIERYTSGRRSARSNGYAMSQQVRERIEQGFGWVKMIGGLRKLPLVGLDAARGWATWAFAAYSLIRLGGIGALWDPSPT